LRRDRLPTPVFLDFPGGSTGKEGNEEAGRSYFKQVKNMQKEGREHQREIKEKTLGKKEN